MSFKEYKTLDLIKVSDHISSFWKVDKTFEKSISSRDKKEFIFYEGPPSANGMPGIHHVMARAIKDIFCRYKTLKGFKVNRKAGWDTHGLPIELGVEKELNISKEDIGSKISIKDYNEACKKAVMKYTDVWNNLTERIGYWVDMENPYITYKSKYIESVWWLLKNLHDKKLIYKGYSVQPYSPKAGTGLSSHELNQPGTYQDITDTTVTAQFECLEESIPNFLKKYSKIYILAWTTTPWTLPSNTALTVGEKIEYCLIKTYNLYTHQPINVVLAKELITKVFKTNFKEVLNQDELIFNNDKEIPYIVVETFLGKDIVGMKYHQIWDDSPLPNDSPENAFRLISGDFVTTEDGTGIVHICTIPVPSSVVTKSPEINLNAFSGLSFGRGESSQIWWYFIPTISLPKNVSTTIYGISLSLLKINSSWFKTSLKFVLKTLVINSFANTTFIGWCVYKLYVLIKQYSIFSPTVKAVFDGNVHGVVVQARI